MTWTKEEKREYMRKDMKTYSGPAKVGPHDELTRAYRPKVVPPKVCSFCSLTIGNVVYRAYRRTYHRNCLPVEPPHEPANDCVRYVYEGGYRLRMAHRREPTLLLVHVRGEVAGEA